MNNEKQLILSELELILASQGFRSRKRIKQFLRYVVHETLAGRGKQLNQYSIAVNAFGKATDFSPTLNPMIRIEAGRLRKLLEAYYTGIGKHSPVRLIMPKGTYEIRLQRQQDALVTDNPFQPEIVAPRTTEGPRLFLNVYTHNHHADTQEQRLTYKLRGDLLLILSRFKNIRLVSSSSPQSGSPLTRVFLQDVWQQYHADFILNCEINSNNDSFDLSCILAHTLSDEVVWKGLFQFSQHPTQAELEAMYRQVMANTVANHTGAALYFWAEYMQSLAEIPFKHRVLVYYLAFLRDNSRLSFIKALESCRQRLEQYPCDTLALIVFSRLCSYDHVLQFNILENLAEQWTYAARMAMKLAPGNADAHSVFAHNCYFRHEYDLSVVEQEVAVQANPFDISTQYLHGLGLCLLEQWDTGIQTIRRVMAIPCHFPDWFYTIPFLYAFSQANYQEALTLAERIQHFGYWGELARSITYFKLGIHDCALNEFKRLLEHKPLFLQEQSHHGLRPLSSHAVLTDVFKVLQEIMQTCPPEMVRHAIVR